MGADIVTTMVPVWRTLRIGGLSKPQLLQQLESQGMQLNEAAHVWSPQDRLLFCGTPGRAIPAGA